MKKKLENKILGLIPKVANYFAMLQFVIPHGARKKGLIACRDLEFLLTY